MISGETQIGWQDYVAIVVRRRWFFAVPCILIVAVAMVWGAFLPKIYRAETLMLVEEQNVMNPLISGLAVSTPVGRRLRTLREEILGWTSLNRLVHELKLDQDVKTPLALENLVKRLQRQIQVRMRGNNFISIAYEDESPRFAQTLVNTVTNIYMARNTESQLAETGTAISFIESEMAVYKQKLEDAERELREFRELYAMQMPVANQLNDQIVGLEVTLAQLLVENTEAHPTIIQVRRRIADLKDQRNGEIKRVIAQALAKGADSAIYQDLAEALDKPQAGSEDPTLRVGKEAYQAWVARMDNPNAAPGFALPTAPSVQVVTAPGPDGQAPDAADIEVLGAQTPLLSLGPRQQQELTRLSRNYQVYSGTYRHLQQRLERAKVTQRLGESDEGTKFKILEPARLPLKPVRPNMMKIFIFSLFLGFFVGAGVAFVAEYLDQSFQTAEDLQGALELPVIGSISTIVTEADIEARRSRHRGWVSFASNLRRLQTYILQPVWARVDRLLVRWNL
jgi:uncharacterized protein involved in exopolysaccharide biosynthesis